MSFNGTEEFSVRIVTPEHCLLAGERRGEDIAQPAEPGLGLRLTGVSLVGEHFSEPKLPYLQDVDCNMLYARAMQFSLKN